MKKPDENAVKMGWKKKKLGGNEGVGEKMAKKVNKKNGGA